MSDFIKRLRFALQKFTHTPFLTLGLLAIIAIAIPLTVNLGTHTTNYQEHASTTSNNWCNSQNPSNALGVCGTHGWGICTTQGSCDTGKNTFDPQQSGGACRGYDNNSGCCYPKVVPKDYGGQSGSYANKAGLCGGGGYGMCLYAGKGGCLDVTNHSFKSIAADGNSACKGYPVANSTNYSVFGCCYPNGLTTSNRKSQVSCNTSGPPPPNQSATTIYDHLDGANCNTGISGWVCQSNYFNQANTVHLYADNPFSSGGKHLYPNTVANINKSSISSLCGGTTKHAFVFPASQLIHDGKEHSYYVYGIDLSGGNNNPLLYPSPVKVTCSASQPTPTPTTNPGEPTATPTPTIPPSNHPTILSLAIQLPGIGIGGNLSPKHPSRIIHISIYKADVDPSQPNVPPILDDKTVHLSYQSNTGYFTNDKVVLKKSIPTGDYQFLIKTQGYLRKEFENTSSSTNTIHIVAGTTTLVPAITLIPGDVTPLYNILDASDFYAIVGCYGDRANTSSCTTGNQITDLNDDGVVNGIDLNLWLGGFASLQTNNNPEGNGDGTIGD